MTQADGKYGEELRSALCAAADVVVPVGDGLEKIRARTTRRVPALDWVQGYFPYVPRQTLYRLRMAGSWLAAAAAGNADVSGSLRATRDRMGLKPGGRKPAQWLRPALAAAGALVIVVAVALAIPRLRENVFATSVGNNAPASSQYANTGSGPNPGAAATAGSSEFKPGALPAFGTKQHRAESSCSQATSSTGSGGSTGSSGGSGSSGGGTGTQTYPAPGGGPTGASPGVVDGAGNTQAGASVAVEKAELMLAMPNPEGSETSVTTYPAPCALDTRPPITVSTQPSTPTTTQTTTTPVTTAPSTTEPVTTPPVTTSPVTTPPTSPSTSTSPTGDGGGSSAPGPGPSGTATPG
ncbi:MAG TPA: hypothetical protein VGH27_10835 [Streptosporangiaceae bacterium]|jgi:hypothetical protein